MVIKKKNLTCGYINQVKPMSVQLDGFENVVINFASFEISTERKYWKVVYIAGYIYEKFSGIIRSFICS